MSTKMLYRKSNKSSQCTEEMSENETNWRCKEAAEMQNILKYFYVLQSHIYITIFIHVFNFYKITRFRELTDFMRLLYTNS